MEQKRNKKNYKKKNQAVKASHTFIQPTEIRPGRNYEYKMPAEEYKALLKEAKKNRGLDGQAYLCNYVNEEYHLLGSCVRVIPA